MSGWKDGFEEYPWCPASAPCPGPRGGVCNVCQQVIIQMDAMERSILEEKKRHDATFDKLHEKELQIDALTKERDVLKIWGERADEAAIESLKDVATWKALAAEKARLLDAAMVSIGEAEGRGYQRAYKEQEQRRQAMKDRCIDKCSHSGDMVCDYEDGTSHCLECIAEKVWNKETESDRLIERLKTEISGRSQITEGLQRDYERAIRERDQYKDERDALLNPPLKRVDTRPNDGCDRLSPPEIAAGTLTCNGKFGHKGRHHTYWQNQNREWD